MKIDSFSEGRRNSNALPSSSYLAVLPTLWMYILVSLGQFSCTTQCTAGNVGCNVCTKQNSSFVLQKKKKKIVIVDFHPLCLGDSYRES